MPFNAHPLDATASPARRNREGAGVMSYCRWSCENGYCDVYVYADVSGGWTTHVAGAALPEGAPECGIGMALESGGGSIGKYKAARIEREKWQESHPVVAINHDDAGKSFNHGTPGECADNLERLRSEGFSVPQYAIDSLREESDDPTQEGGK